MKKSCLMVIALNLLKKLYSDNSFKSVIYTVFNSYKNMKNTKNTVYGDSFKVINKKSDGVIALKLENNSVIL